MHDITPEAVVIGVDTHKDVHVAVALSGLGARLGATSVPVTSGGYRQLADWAASFGPVHAFGIEGTGSYGAGLTRALVDEGICVVEVNRPNRQLRRQRGKSDIVDAEAAARAVLAGEAGACPKSGDGRVEMIRHLKIARDTAVKARTQAMVTLKTMLVNAPQSLREQFIGMRGKMALIRALAALRPGDMSSPTASAKAALRALARRWLMLDAEIKEHDAALEALVREQAPTLMAAMGISTGTIADMLVVLGDNPERIRSEAAFASLCGVCPIPASSGKTNRHRLNRGGNRRANLMIKIMRLSNVLEMGAFVGIDPESDGLKRAERLGVPITAQGIDGLVKMPEFKDIGIVFDATSAGAHKRNNEVLQAHGKRVVDLTPAAIGPYTIPPVNGAANLDAPNVNMVTCGGQATIPIVAAVNRVAKVHYGEIVASIASKSAGPGTRANIDEFTETTSQAIVDVGGATRGKAIIILNPAEPPLIMRDTVYCLCEDGDRAAIAASVEEMVREVQAYVPGYRLKQAVQFEHIGSNRPLRIPEMDGEFTGLKVSVFLEVEGAAHYLPAYAGNLDIMTSAALRTAEKIAGRMAA